MATIIGNCNKCALPVDTAVDAFTVCEGVCSKPFHATCASVSDAALSVLSSNILWICDGCLADFCRYRERKSTDSAAYSNPTRSIEEEIVDLKSTVANVVATLAEITQKRRPLIPQHSSPISSLEQHGVGENLERTDRNERTEVSSPSSRTEECSCFSLYLSRIHNSATENDVRQLVSHSLGAPLSNCLKVEKLVPKWKDTGTLEYISFKVELEKKWKPVALSSSTWPKAVKYREFVNRLNDTWRPN